MTKISDSELVTNHIKQLEPTLKKAVERLRDIILSTDIEVAEHIKWNNPCFYYLGEIKSFNPKEYKREIIVFNLFKGRVMLVWPSGAKLKDDNQLLTGKYRDGRRVIIFNDETHIIENKDALQSLIKQWISLVEK